MTGQSLGVSSHLVVETRVKTPSHVSAGDNVALPGSPSAWGVHYFVIAAGSSKTIEASFSCGAWMFTSNTERKMTCEPGEVCLYIVDKEP